MLMAQVTFSVMPSPFTETNVIEITIDYLTRVRRPPFAFSDC